MANSPVVGTIGIDTISRYVGLIGGVLGVIATIGGAVVWTVAYFATRSQLEIVDCHHYYVQESLSAQTTQVQMLSTVLDLDGKVTATEVAIEQAPKDVSLRTKLEQLKRERSIVFDAFKREAQKSHDAIAEKNRCGYKAPKRS